MNKWTGKNWEELFLQALKNHYDLMYKKPDLTKPLLFPWQVDRIASEPIFQEYLANMNENEIAEWNTKQLKFWNEAHHE